MRDKGDWSSDTYDTTVKRNRAAGKDTFDYSAKARSGAVSKVNKLLDPKVTAGPGSAFEGKVMREVIATDKHPNPTAIGIVLDVTGSNITAARTVHSKLPKLFSMLQTKGYADDPQINISATGDSNCDRFPIQFGQFESDNAIDDQLGAMILESGGGGQDRETYEQLAYLFARHTYLEPLEKSGKKGYLFFIGDEMPYKKVRSAQISALTGIPMEEDVDTKVIFDELKEKYEVFYLFQVQGMYREEEIMPEWRKYLGERVIALDDPAQVCDTIAGIVGVLEQKVNIDDLANDLSDLGTDQSLILSTSKAVTLASQAAGRGVANKPSFNQSPIAKSVGSLPDLGIDLDTTTRI